MTNCSSSTSSSVVPASQAPPAAPLRIIRMPASKPWRRPERPPPQVFLVHRAGFRELVQRLTGAPPMDGPRSHPSESVIEEGSAAPPPPGPPVAISDRLQSFVDQESRRFGWPSPADPATGYGIETTTTLFGRFQQPVAISDRMQSHVDEGGSRFGEEHQCVWPSPADPAVGDWINTTTACFGSQQPVAISDRLQSYVEEEGLGFGEEHQCVWPSPVDPAARDWRFQGR